MKLLGLTLETEHFEDYLSFLTEVLELELDHLDDSSMLLSLQDNLVEIRRSPGAPQHKNIFIRFQLDSDEYESLVSKISFYTYRKGKLAFSLEKLNSEICRLVDPDGRTWCFSHTLTISPANSVEIW